MPNELLKNSRAYAYDVYEPAIRAANRAVRQFGQLVPPPGQSAAYHSLLHTLAQQLEANVAVARAMEIGSYRVIRDSSEFRHTLRRRSNQTLKHLGLNACVGK